MGQIKNIKLHIVTDIKRIKNSQKDERQVEEEKSAKVEEEEKKDERKIKVNNISCHGDGTTTSKQRNEQRNMASISILWSFHLSRMDYCRSSRRKQPLYYDQSRTICDGIVKAVSILYLFVVNLSIVRTCFFIKYILMV